MSVPQDIGLAGFNGVDLIDGLPKRLATVDTGRVEIGTIAAEIIARVSDEMDPQHEKKVELMPVFAAGDTLRPLD